MKIGRDAMTNEEREALDVQRRDHLARWNFADTLIATVIEFRYRSATVDATDEVEQLSVALAALVNVSELAHTRLRDTGRRLDAAADAAQPSEKRRN